MKRPVFYNQYNELNSCENVMDFDINFTLHSDISKKLAFEFFGFPKSVTYYRVGYNDQVELLTYIDNVFLKYAVYSSDLRNTIIYDLGEDRFNIFKNFELSYVKNILLKRNGFGIFKFAREIKQENDKLFASKILVSTIGYRFDLEERQNLEIEEVLEFYDYLHNLKPKQKDSGVEKFFKELGIKT